MSPERWRRVREVFDGAVERAEAERAAWVEAACIGDPELLAEVERLLAADRNAGSFLAGPAWVDPDEISWEGRRLGPYRVEREIGRGGMGTVYAASRADGLFEKQVAVKVVRAGLDTADVLRRFEREREILGRLEHPGIARLLDAGATPEGRPYLVMELVEGVPLDRWSAGEREIGERLRIFLEVCAAVEHAHRNLVAHRDLKPANILVDAAGRPRLLDFGIARLLEGDDPGDLTRVGARPMTPGYASPEQVRGEPVTAASDVWSLGVLLYELLAGRHPFRREGRTPREVERIVCEEDPEPPSRAAADPRRRGRLAGDLDAVVLRALRREPERRYPSVDRLAEDVRRHLEGRPVAARGGGFWYRAGRFVRRHKVAAAFLGLLLAFSAGMAMLAAERARAARRAERTADLLVELFRLSDPRGEAGSVTVREVLGRGVERVEKDLAEGPEIQGALLAAIGRAYLNLGLPGEAAPALRRALELRRKAFGERHADVAASLDDLARALRDQGDWAAAEPLARRGLSLRRELLGPADPEVARSLNNLGLLLQDKGEFAAAEAALAEAVELRRRLPPDEQHLLAESLTNLAVVRQSQGDYAGAEPLYEEAVDLYKKKLGPHHPNVAAGLNNLALAIYRQGRPAEAEPLLREALALHRRSLGPDHPDVASTLENLGLVLDDRGDFAAAEAFSREALALHRRRLGDRHRVVALGMNNLARILHGKGDLAEAEALFREALALRRALLPPDHPETGSSLVGLGAVLVDRGQAAQAEPLLREGLALRRAALPGGHWRTAAAEAELGACLLALGDRPGAEALLAGALPVLRKSLGEDHRQTRRAESRLAALRSRPSR